MLRGNIAATSLKMLLKNLYSVKCYDKLNINVLTFSLWENFWWGLIYFDQFIIGATRLFWKGNPLSNSRISLVPQDCFERENPCLIVEYNWYHNFVLEGKPPVLW